MRCALNSDGTRLAIMAKTGQYYDSQMCAGYLYDLSDLENVPEPMELEGNFQQEEKAGRILFTSDDRFVLASFGCEAFGTSPSICAYDAKLGIPIAWFVSPLHNKFIRMSVPPESCAKFVAVDDTGKIYVFHIEEN